MKKECFHSKLTAKGFWVIKCRFSLSADLSHILNPRNLDCRFTENLINSELHHHIWKPKMSPEEGCPNFLSGGADNDSQKNERAEPQGSVTSIIIHAQLLCVISVFLEVYFVRNRLIDLSKMKMFHNNNHLIIDVVYTNFFNLLSICLYYIVSDIPFS